MTFLADDKCCVIQFAAMEPSPGTRPILPELAPDTVEVLQAATRVLAGVARRSIGVLDGCGDPAAAPDARGPGRPRADPVRPDAPGAVLETPIVSRLAGRLAAAGHLTRGSEPDHPKVVTLALAATCQDLARQVAAGPRQGLPRILWQLPPAACRQANHRTAPACRSSRGGIRDDLLQSGVRVANPSRRPSARPSAPRAPRAHVARVTVHRPGQRPAGGGLPQLLSIRQTGRVPEC
jgi:hypothetical protein